jgi:NAD(P)-dependent dehydrogenase (short-subunit alcohol dehydrogenase family)
VDRPARPMMRYRSRWLSYAASKQANILFTVEAARRWSHLGVVPTCFFPGLVRTRFARSSFMFGLSKLAPVVMRSAGRGAQTLVWLATEPAGAQSPGQYFYDKAPFVATPMATDPQRAQRLWTASRSAVGLVGAG